METTGHKVYTEPPQHEWRCKNCKFWESWEDLNEPFGICRQPISIDAVRIYQDSFSTREDFGCVHFEKGEKQ